MTRCRWVGDDPSYISYHDTEWGVPQHCPYKLWEMLTLESFQAGLSWITILRKRENFRAAFARFDPEIVAGFNDADVARLCADPGIVRHKGKIQAAIRGAQAFLRIEAQGSFHDLLWDSVDGQPLINHLTRDQIAPTQTPQSQALSKRLKTEGFGFVGPTICYAFMQAAGLVNDHEVSCPRHKEVQALS